jgi:hypothetical protein
MTRSAVLLIALVAVCCAPGSRTLAAEDIVFRSTVSPESPWVGQKVLLRVDVLANDGWAQLKKIHEIEVDGAYVLRLETQGTRLSEVIDGGSYTGQRYEFMIFAQREGKFTIPPVPVDVEVTRWGSGAGKQAQRMSLPAVEFTVQTPPGAQGIRGLISTTDLRATQTWDPEPDELTVGDAIERTITLHAADVSGMAFTPMRYNEIETLGIYPGEPTVDDKFNRGDLSGTRVETVTYVFERPGQIEIPGITLSWWDVQSAKLQRIELPGISVEVIAGAEAESEVAAAAPQQLSMQLIGSVLFAIVLLAALAFRFGGRFLDHLAAWQRARLEDEANYFKQVMRSVRSGEKKMVLRDTMRWLDRINGDSIPARLDQFLLQYGDSQTQVAAANLVKALNKQTDQSNLTVFARGFAAARARWRKAGRVRQKADSLLPSLNGSN